MSEKIRGALFNALGDIESLTVLDAFTGTGAIAIEAISRGAKSVLALDNDSDAFKNAVANVRSLTLEKQITVVCINAVTWSNRSLKQNYNIVIADPPFDVINDVLINKISRHCIVGGIYIVSLSQDYPVRDLKNFELLSSKVHGDAKLLFYRRTI